MGKVERFIEIAKQAAQRSNMDFKHGAALVKGGKLLDIGWNSRRNCLDGRDIPSLHAEVAVLQNKTLNLTKGSDLFIVRDTTTGFGGSKPCNACLRTLKEYGVKTVYYSTRDGIIEEDVSDVEGYEKWWGPESPYFAPTRPTLKPAQM